MTNHLSVRTTEEFNADYQPKYAPLMPLFLSEGRSKQYDASVGSVNFTTVDAVGDVRNKMVTPKDTELHQITSKEGTRAFKKYFHGSQYRQSSLQDVRGYERVVGQVLDEHNKQHDEILLTGEGTSMANPINNGLYFSKDPNYVLNGDLEIAKDSNGSHLTGLYAQVVSDVQKAQKTAGQIIVLFYGADTLAAVNGMFPTTNVPMRKALADAFEDEDVTLSKLPEEITPAGASGYIVINLDNVTLHYVLPPQVRGQGVNEEKMYAWTNFLMGSTMLEVEAPAAVIRQPLTYAA